jgi:hypothetical protein
MDWTVQCEREDVSFITSQTTRLSPLDSSNRRSQIAQRSCNLIEHTKRIDDWLKSRDSFSEERNLKFIKVCWLPYLTFPCFERLDVVDHRRPCKIVITRETFVKAKNSTVAFIGTRMVAVSSSSKFARRLYA